ncbi:hypothetical protein H5410_030247 [Solanum commersonii]|uniref:Uncharacterized protein n=1 Tax=Solanum commersonii TaxID=4109 RepID=A0A9J5YFL0_SOLCO|nr:hypothetical protein H5410_030247 [Solanum commersonii]
MIHQLHAVSYISLFQVCLDQHMEESDNGKFSSNIKHNIHQLRDSDNGKFSSNIKHNIHRPRDV